jgi:glycosyltransferase involved in cell wall biosynthesis
VNDGSKDKTSEVAQSYVNKFGDDKIRVCNLFKNCGKGGAVRKVQRAR